MFKILHYVVLVQVVPPKTNARTTNALTRTFSPVQYSNVNGTVSNNYIKNFYGNNAPVSYH